MSHKSSKSGVLERAGELSEDTEETGQDSDDVSDGACGGKQLKNVYEHNIPGIHKNEQTFVSGGNHQRSNRKQLNRSPKNDTSAEHRFHDNPAFLDDDGSYSVTDISISPASNCGCHKIDDHEKTQTKHLEAYGRDRRVSAWPRKRIDETETKDTNNKHYHSLCEHTNVSHHLASPATAIIFPDGETDNRPSRRSTLAPEKTCSFFISESNDHEMKPHLDKTTHAESVASLDIPSQHQACVDNVHVVPVRPTPLSGISRTARPNSRSVYAAASMFHRGVDSDQTPETGLQSVYRSYSMRLPTDHDQGKLKTRTLLRDLSFSDADAQTARNYGSLRGGLFMPRRRPIVQEDVQEDISEDIHTQMGPELRSHLRNLIQELLSRGKIRQVAILSTKTCSTLVSVPPWELLRRDEVGLVKAVTSTAQNIIKMTVGHENYTFFKHGSDKMMGRSGDNLLVAQKTKVCVVVGVADDNTPGSCLYEVSELVNAMVNKGW